jgi:putative NIF3 family GTP cyclohydrolase 1 type 2
MDSPSSANLWERRAFLATTLKAAGGSTLLSIPGFANNGSALERATAFTVQEVIDIILKQIPGGPISPTVDTLKCGKPEQLVSAVVTTMFPTIPVIEGAIQQGANFIIAHEPSFYNHTDDLAWVPENAVMQKKRDLLNKHGLAIWRFHDHWHRYRPDGINYGVLKELGWLSYLRPDSRIIRIPPLSLKDLAMKFKSSLGITHVRIIGNPQQSCERLALLEGAAGGQVQIGLVEKEHPDVLVVGEVHEWETAEYIRDSLALGNKTSLIVLGHGVSEEPGMAWLVEWLRPLLPRLQISHIPSGDPFQWW